MPEGDTIWLAAAELRRRVGGRQVISARPAALSRLAGRTLLRVDPIGKHLYMHFSGGLVLHTHMRMTGAWHVYARGQPPRRASHLQTAVVDFGDARAVLYAAPLCELIAEAAVGDRLGPDILAVHLDVADVVARVRAAAHPTIGEAMLDQRVCAGIGNIHRCEALWHEAVTPAAPPSALADEVIERLYMRARDQMRRNVVGDGFRSRRAVHGRSGRPCIACGTLIRSAPLGRPSRTIFWCPVCQAAARPPSGRGQHPVGDRDPLQQRCRQDQAVEDLVEAERARPRVGPLAGVDDRARDVHGAAEGE